MNLKQLFATSAGLILLTSSIGAQEMSANEKKVAEFFKDTIKEIREFELEPIARLTEIDDIYEITVDNEIQGYTNLKGSFIFSGLLINPKNLENLTAKREEELNRVDIASLPLNQAIKVVNGEGQRILYTFEDPRCTYCKQLGENLREMKDVTIHIFPVAFLGPESEKRAKAVMCAKDPAAAWFETLLEDKVPNNDGECKQEFVEENTKLAAELNVRGTPSIFFTDGSRFRGFAKMEIIEAKLKTIK